MQVAEYCLYKCGFRKKSIIYGKVGSAGGEIVVAWLDR